MSISISNIRENHRALAFRFTGDGSTANVVVNHTRHVRTNHTAKAYVVTGANVFSARSGRGGLLAAEDGTPVTASVSISGSIITVTCSPAVGNGLVADVVVVHDAATASD